MQRQPGAGHADGMPQAIAPPLTLTFVAVDPELAGRTEARLAKASFISTRSSVRRGPAPPGRAPRIAFEGWVQQAGVGAGDRADETPISAIRSEPKLLGLRLDS